MGSQAVMLATWTWPAARTLLAHMDPEFQIVTFLCILTSVGVGKTLSSLCQLYMLEHAVSHT